MSIQICRALPWQVAEHSFVLIDGGSVSRLGAAEMRGIGRRIGAGQTKIFIVPFHTLSDRIKEEAAKLAVPQDEGRTVYHHDVVYLCRSLPQQKAGLFCGVLGTKRRRGRE